MGHSLVLGSENCIKINHQVFYFIHLINEVSSTVTNIYFHTLFGIDVNYFVNFIKILIIVILITFYVKKYKYSE